MLGVALLLTHGEDPVAKPTGLAAKGVISSCKNKVYADKAVHVVDVSIWACRTIATMLVLVAWSPLSAFWVRSGGLPADVLIFFSSKAAAQLDIFCSAHQAYAAGNAAQPRKLTCMKLSMRREGGLEVLSTQPRVQRGMLHKLDQAFAAWSNPHTCGRPGH